MHTIILGEVAMGMREKKMECVTSKVVKWRKRKKNNTQIRLIQTNKTGKNVPLADPH